MIYEQQGDIVNLAQLTGNALLLSISKAMVADLVGTREANVGVWWTL